MFAWLNKHKGKFLVLGAAVAGSYVGGKYLLALVYDTDNHKSLEQQDNHKLERHCKNHSQTCLNAVVCLLPRLKEALQNQLNTEEITKQLQTSSSSKVTLWENLKIICFSRVVVSVYICSAVSIILRIQMSILGGILLHKQQDNDDNSMTEQQYLSSVHYLIGDGLVELVSHVRRAAEQVLVSYSLKHQLTAEGVRQLIRDIHTLSITTSSDDEQSILLQFLLPREQPSETAVVKSTLAAATRDIIESCEFSAVLNDCIIHGMASISHTLADIHHSAAQSEATLPVARVIPIITDIFDNILFTTHQSSTTLIHGLVANTQLHKLSYNIFETFCKTS